MTASEPPVLAERKGKILRLCLNRPGSANAINREVVEALVKGLAEAQAEEEIGAVVLTGTGGRVFSGGADIKNPDGLDPKALHEQRRRNTQAYTGAFLAFDKPLVVALNGIASGAGLMLALHADLIVAAEHAELTLPEIDIGIPTFLAHALIAIRLGDAVANDLALTGRRMPAGEALRLGLLAAVVPAEALQSEAEARALFLAAKPREAFRRMKGWILERRRRAVDRAFSATNALDARAALAAGRG